VEFEATKSLNCFSAFTSFLGTGVPVKKRVLIETECPGGFVRPNVGNSYLISLFLDSMFEPMPIG
jgi:hypothetical protein